MIKYIKTNSIIASLMLLGAFMLQACSDSESFDVTGNPNNLAYIQLVGKAENLLTYTVTKTPFGVENDIKGKFPVRILRATEENVTMKVEQNNALLDAYNAANGTSYLAAPVGLINIENATLIVEKGATVSTDSISYVTNEAMLSALEPGKIYLLPLQITTISSNNVQVSTNKSCVYMVINTQYKAVRENSTSMLGTLISSYTGWTYTSANTTGAIANFWTTSTSAYVTFTANPASITFNMQELKKVTGLRIYARGGTSASYRLNNAKMSLSRDGVTFTEIADLSISQMAYASNYQYICMYGGVEAQYLKLDMNFVTATTSYWAIINLGVYAE